MVAPGGPNARRTSSGSSAEASSAEDDDGAEQKNLARRYPAKLDLPDSRVPGKRVPLESDSSKGKPDGGPGQLAVEPETVHAVQSAWSSFITNAGSKEDLAEAILDTIHGAFHKESAVDVLAMFAAPKAVQSMRLLDSISGLVKTMKDPGRLQVMVETLGFQHLSLEVEAEHVPIFTDAVLDAVADELGDGWDPKAREGLSALLTYAGRAIVLARTSAVPRIEIITESWRIANDKSQHDRNAGNSKKGFDEMSGSSSSGSTPRKEYHQNHGGNHSATKHHSADKAGGGDAHGKHHHGKGIPTTFVEMFEVNAAVMGINKTSMTWMQNLLESFDTLAVNVSNITRITEEVDVLSLKISKHPQDKVDFQQFKPCLLAALRSLLPKEWSTAHEEAWAWLADNIMKLLRKNMTGMLATYETGLQTFIEGLDTDQFREMFVAVFDKFFELEPAGEEFFKASNTRLTFIAERILKTTHQLFIKPKKMVSEISALGLRHVGFGIPVEFIAPFVTANVKIIRKYTEEDTIVEGFRWSMALVGKILARAVDEGSTVVMKAINANSTTQLRKAIDAAPRGKRANWLLDIQVGDQHISPLDWAIETGSMAVADAIIKDLLTIRADRARYYYGVEELFRRHNDLVKRLCEEAPMLLPTLLDGLIWRSHRTHDGMRRVNNYVKHMIVNKDGRFSDSLKWISSSGDPVIVSHPIVSLLADTLWSGIVLRQFIYSRTWNMVSLLIFILSQNVLPDINRQAGEVEAIGTAIFVMRLFNYTVGLGRLAKFHLSRIWYWSRNTMRRIIEEIDTDGNGQIDYEEMMEALHKFKDTVKDEIKKAIKVLRDDDGPGTADETRKGIANKEKNMYSIISLTLMLLLAVMCTHEPMFWCVGAPTWPTENCPRSEGLTYRYSVFSMSAMAVHWLILIDLAVFSTEISAFLLVCGHVISEVRQFLTALCFLLLTFGSSISIMCRTSCPVEGGDFSNMPSAIVSLFAITIGLYQGDYRDIQEDAMLLGAVFLFLTFSVVLLLNLLIAQLNRSYEYIYKDMLGFARLNRASLIVDAMASCPKSRWHKFVDNLNLDKELEFDEGDLGPPGGIQTLEQASVHRQSAESVRRYGGSTSPEAPWPAEKVTDQEENRLARIEKLIHKALRQANRQSNGGLFQHSDLGDDSSTSDIGSRGKKPFASGGRSEASRGNSVIS